MEYRFLDPGDEQLLASCELPRTGGIAITLRTTGYDLEKDEIVQLAICDLEGNGLFCETVKPQNVDNWIPSEASGGLGPADVEDCPELYQFEEQISDLFQDATVSVALHSTFAKAMIEGSWVTLPETHPFDLTERFCATHSTCSLPNQPAATASLETIEAYYSLPQGHGTLLEEAASIASAYGLMIDEACAQRDAKGEAYWEAYRKRLEEASASDRRKQEVERLNAMKTTRINAILWLCAAAIFSNLAVQMSLRGSEMSLVVMIGAVAVFMAIKWIQALYRLYKLHNQRNAEELTAPTPPER